MADQESNVVLNFKMDGQVEYAKTIRDINAIMNAAASEYKTHVAAMGKDASQTEKLAAEKKKLEVQLEAGQQRTEQLRAEYEALSESTNTSAGQLANKYKELQNSERAEIALEGALERVNGEMSEQAEEARKAEEALNQLETESEELEQQSDKLNAQYDLQKAQLGENASESEKLQVELERLTDQHELAGEKVDNYEQQLEEAKNMYGETSPEVEKYETQLIEAKTAEQELANDIVSTNKELEEQSDTLKNTSKNMKEAGDKMTKAGKGMSKYVTAPIVGIGAAAFASAKKTADFADDVLNSSQEAGIGAEAYQELTLALQDFGLGEDDSGKALGRLNQRMGLAKEGSDKYADALGELGISQEDIENGTYDTDEAFMKTIDSLSEIEDEQERAAKASDLYGTKLSRKMMPAIKEGGDALEELREEVSESGKVMGEDALNDAAEFGIELEGLKDDFAGVGRSAMSDLIPVLRDELLPVVQDQILPMFEDFTEWISDVIEWFSELSPGMQQAIVVFTGLAAAIGPLLVIGGSLMSIISGLIAILPALGTALTVATGPVGLIIAAIAALVAIGIAVWKNWDTIKEKAVEIWTSISEWFSEVWQWILDIFEQALNWLDEKTNGGFSVMVEVIKDYMTMAQENIKAVWSFVRDTFKNALDFLKALVTGDFQGMKDAIKNQMENSKGLIDDIWSNIKSFLGGITGDILKGVTNKFKDIVTNVGDKVQETYNKVKNKFNQIKDAIMNPIEKAKDAFQSAVDKIKGMFDFEFSWPKIPLPHFSISGSKNPLDWIDKGVPKIDVDWRAKGGIFTEPTIFGANGGNLQGAGEAGPEAVIPLNQDTLSGIGKGIADASGGTGDVNVNVYLDTDEVNSKLAPGMSKKINSNNKMTARSKGVIL